MRHLGIEADYSDFLKNENVVINNQHNKGLQHGCPQQMLCILPYFY